MGRRAKKAPVVTKKRPTLAKRFKCPFCANEGAVECKMDFRGGVGSLTCRLCAASYQMPIHHLHEPIDVFSEWLDDCEAAANQRNGGGGGDQGAAAPRYQEEDDEDDDDIPQAVEFNGGRKSNKRPAESSSSSNKQQKTSEGGTKDTYTALGLDDSDSDSDED